MYARTIPNVKVRGVYFVDDSRGIDREDPSHCGEVTLQKGNDPPGVLCYTKTFQATFHHNCNLRKFPFEQEQLVIVLELTGSHDPTDVDNGRVLLPINVEVC